MLEKSGKGAEAGSTTSIGMSEGVGEGGWIAIATRIGPVFTKGFITGCEGVICVARSGRRAR